MKITNQQPTMTLQLKTHPVWQDLTEVLANLDANALVTEHLELSR